MLRVLLVDLPIGVLLAVDPHADTADPAIEIGSAARTDPSH